MQESFIIGMHKAQVVKLFVIAAIDDTAVAHGQRGIFADSVADKLSLCAEVAQPVTTRRKYIASQAVKNLFNLRQGKHRNFYGD